MPRKSAERLPGKSATGVMLRIEEILELVVKHAEQIGEQQISEAILAPFGNATRHVLIACSADEERRRIRQFLTRKGHQSSVVEVREKVVGQIAQLRPDVLVLDSSLCDTQTIPLLMEAEKMDPALVRVVVADEKDKESIIDAYQAGADLVLPLGIEPAMLLRGIEEVVARQRALVQSHLSRAQIDKHIAMKMARFFRQVKHLREKAMELGGAYHDVVDRLRRAAQWRDDETGDHIKRIGLFSREVGGRLGLTERDQDLLGEAAPLHDLGKIGVPDKILLKPGKLTELEFEWMKTHTLIGAEILSGSHDPLLQSAESIALNHHEWFNGKGYPNGIAGNKIPLFSKIVSVVDVYDALIHQRTYKEAISMDQSIDTMLLRRETQFDPQVFDAFLDSVEDLTKIESRLQTSGAHTTKYRIQFGMHSMTQYLDEKMKNA